MHRLPILALFLAFSAQAQMRPLLGGGSAGVAPIANGAVAAKATAEQNSLCTVIAPFYIEIGNATQTLWSDNVGGITSTTQMAIASASKWQGAEYIASKRAGYSNFTAADIAALNFTDGYANMGDSTTGGQCPSTGTIASCLLLPGLVNPAQTNGWQNPALIGLFDYDAAHLQNLMGTVQTEIATLATANIYPKYITAFGLSPPLGTFTSPLPAGAIYTTPAHYALVLQQVLSTAALSSILGQSQVCAYTTPFASTGNLNGGCPTAYFSPIAEKWNYSMGHWVEVDTTQHNDFSFSSPGAYGFYPWIQPLCSGARCTTAVAAASGVPTYYGLLARQVAPGASPTGNGQASGKCAALVRYAWLSGIQQSGTIPP